MLPLFALPFDLAAFTNRTLDDAQAEQVLAQATGLIQGWTAQTLFQVVDDVVVADPMPDGYVFLPELPVTAVSKVEWFDDRGGTGWNTIPTNQYRFKSWGKLYIVPNSGFNPAQWPSDEDTIRVTYTHGYDPIPKPIYDVCVSLAARLLLNPFKLVSQRTGGVQVVYTGPRETSELLDTEQRALDRYTVMGFA